MSTRYLTTGQVADMLSVKSDTVLKWIRSGLLPARRTAGGHHRVNQDDLEQLNLVLNKSPEPSQPQAVLKKPSIQYCWEFYSKNGLPEDCLGCAVYNLRAQRCYEVARQFPEAKILKTYCKKTCEECEYYDLVHEQNTNILIVTQDKKWAEDVTENADSLGINLQIADSGYSCSLLISDFRPDYAVIDCSIGPEVRDISNNLAIDPRIPKLRIILAGNECEFPKECDKKIFARMERPAGLFEITHVIDSKTMERI
jgi:excisionase family DNA binding protein